MKRRISPVVCWTKSTTVLLFVSIMATASFAMTACGDDSGGGLQSGQRSEIRTTPNPLSFNGARIGTETKKIFKITNGGKGKLKVTSLALNEKGGGEFDAQREFSKGDVGWGDIPFVLDPGQSHNVAVNYRPADKTKDVGTVTIESNATQAEYTVDLTSQSLLPDLSNIDDIHFGRVKARDDDPDFEDYRVLQVQNVGGAPLELSDVYVADNDQFGVSFPQPVDENSGASNSDPKSSGDDNSDGSIGDPANDSDQWPDVVQPNEVFLVRVSFHPEDDLPASTQLVFESNDPDESRYAVEVTANTGAACMQVSPEETIAFGQGSLGQTSQQTITIANCSRSSDLNIDSIEVTSDGGGVFAIQDGTRPDGLPDTKAVIPARERANFVVTFEPTAEDDYHGELVIKSNDAANSPKSLAITGNGSDNQCPTAKAYAHLIGGNRKLTQIDTIPRKTVQFDGSDSLDPGAGTVEEYKWTILSRPQGSTSRLLNSNTQVDPHLLLDIAGTYEVELKVIDNEGALSCGEPAKVTIIAIPDDDVHTQLVWNTPSDPDETDTFGADLDLHYMHPNGHWNNVPWDIFWRHPTEDWGPPGSEGNPSLDVDDRDGAGPENINHSNLENLTYKIGVNYYNDNNLGASYATVRVYIRGTLALEVENKYMPRAKSFWYVGKLQWPSANITRIDTMSRGFPSVN